MTNRTKPDLNLRDLLDLVKREIMLSVNCSHLGTIQSFDATKQTATVRINYKQAFEQADQNTGKYSTVFVDYPLLIDVPVVVLQGGGGGITFPIAQGDACLLIFNDRDIDGWIHSGQVSALETPRMHSISDGIAIVGLRHLQNTMEDYDEEKAVFFLGNTKIKLGDKITIENESRSLKTILETLLTSLSTASNFTQVNNAALLAKTSLLELME